MRELPDGTKVVDDPKLQTGKMEFHRPSSDGDAADFAKLQKFAWQSERVGGDVHLQANPTAGEIKHKKLVEEAKKKRSAIRSSVLDKYGGAEHLSAPPKELLKSTEQFTEYTKSGELIKGKEAPSTKSRYPEDGMFALLSVPTDLVFPGNHTSVYGSFFRDGRWGFACCHQFHKNSYCTGQAGIEADEAQARMARGEIDDMPPPSLPMKSSKSTESSSHLRDAIKDGTKRKRPEDGGTYEDQKMTKAEISMVSEEEYEDYRRNKMARNEDPLNAMQQLEGLV